MGKSLLALLVGLFSFFWGRADDCVQQLGPAAINGTDVVSFRSLLPGSHAVQGTSEFAVQFGNFTFSFVSKANALLFEENPTYYAPVW